MARASQRKKNAPVMVKGTLDLGTKQVELEVKAPEETWYELLDAYYRDPSLFSNAFHDDFVGEAIAHLERRIPKGGLTAEEWDFKEKVKRYSAFVFCLCEYWLEKPNKEWPDPIKEAVALLQKPFTKRKEEEVEIAGDLELISDDTQEVQRPYPAILTAYFAEKYFHKERIDSGVYKKWTDHFETFRRVFIMNNKRYINHYRTKILPFLQAKFGESFKDLPFDTGELVEIIKKMREDFKRKSFTSL